jgi:hypothetical protein
LGNKYEHKNRTQRGGAGVGGFDVGSRWRVVMQHVIERNIAVSAMSTLATDFFIGFQCIQRNRLRHKDGCR